MSPKVQKTQKWALASVALHDAYTDFILSRQAMLCSLATMQWYGFTAGYFVRWLKDNGVQQPDEISARHVRAYLASLTERGLADSSLNGHARAIRTFLKFCLAENYTSQDIKFTMPNVGKKRLPVLSADELKQLIAACKSPRDLALIMFLADTGTRRAELCSLNWGDINLENGVTRIAQGKGNKSRSVIVGIKTRRALLKYRRTMNSADNAPLFQTRQGQRLAASGVRSLLLRISRRAGISVSPHVLRRTFATLSLRAGMNVLHLQGLMGHSTLEMTRHYVQMLDDDLLTAHQQHGPIDNL